ncbi:SWI SNF, matrix associated, actin dependent regulator of chromatin, sub b, member 1, partial [Nowakowskiella sp. JEL0078]
MLGNSVLDNNHNPENSGNHTATNNDKATPIIKDMALLNKPQFPVEAQVSSFRPWVNPSTPSKSMPASSTAGQRSGLRKKLSSATPPVSSLSAYSPVQPYFHPSPMQYPITPAPHTPNFAQSQQFKQPQPPQLNNNHLARLLSEPNALIWSTSKASSQQVVVRKRGVDSEESDEYSEDDEEEEEEIVNERSGRGTRRTMGLQPVNNEGGVERVWQIAKMSGAFRKRKKVDVVLGKDTCMKEVLVPIRVNLDLDGFKLRDGFMWNVNETLFTPEKLAEQFCDDMNLPLKSFSGPIANTIRTQIAEYSSMVELLGINIDPKELQENSEMLSKKKPETFQLIPEDTRVIIRLDINIGTESISDQFEWELSSTNITTPEEFARILVADLGLGLEFVTLISHSIHEQLHRYRALWIQSHDPLKQIEIGAPLFSGFRWVPSKVATIEQPKPASDRVDLSEILGDSDSEVDVTLDVKEIDEKKEIELGQEEKIENPIKTSNALGERLEMEADLWGPKTIELSKSELDRIVQEKERNV